MAGAGKVWVDGQVVNADEARVPVFDRGFLYGDSVYEVTRTFGGHPFALDEHLDRLGRSAAALELALPTRGAIERAVTDTIRATSEAELYIRIVVTRGSGPIGLDPALADAARLVVMALPLKLPEPELYEKGVTVAIVGARRNGPGSVDPQVKSGNYLNSVLGVAEARRLNAYEALMCDAVGRIAEGSSSNLFVVRGRRLATPPLSVGLLEGITRHHVLGCARRLNLSVDEVPLWPDDLVHADEAFLTSSVRGVLPIARVLLPGSATPHTIQVHPGPVTRQISATYLSEGATTRAEVDPHKHPQHPTKAHEGP